MPLLMPFTYAAKLVKVKGKTMKDYRAQHTLLQESLAIMGPYLEAIDLGCFKREKLMVDRDSEDNLTGLVVLWSPGGEFADRELTYSEALEYIAKMVDCVR